jgi:hypothetical protein
LLLFDCQPCLARGKPAGLNSSDYALAQNAFKEKTPEVMLEELPKIGVSDQFLCALAVSSRLAIARRLRSETTMSLKWVAQRLSFSSWKHMSNLLNQPLAESVNSQSTLGL